MNFADVIISSHVYLEEFDYDHYPGNFRIFEAQCAPLFDALGSGKEMDFAKEAEALLDSLEAGRRDLPRRRRQEAAYRDKQVLALFFSPAAERHSAAAKEFAARLNDLWNRHDPRNRYLTGNYDQIMKGFDANLLGLPLRKSRQR